MAADGLTDQQRAFVRDYVQNGGNGAAAARAAGYSAPNARMRAYDLLKMPAVRDAIRREQDAAMRELENLAIGTLRSLLTTPGTQDKIRLEASKTVLDRVGRGAQVRVDVSSSDRDLAEMSAAELEEYLRAMRAAQARIIDVEAVDVEKASDIKALPLSIHNAMPTDTHMNGETGARPACDDDA